MKLEMAEWELLREINSKNKTNIFDQITTDFKGNSRYRFKKAKQLANGRFSFTFE